MSTAPLKKRNVIREVGNLELRVNDRHAELNVKQSGFKATKALNAGRRV